MGEPMVKPNFPLFLKKNQNWKDQERVSRLEKFKSLYLTPITTNLPATTPKACVSALPSQLNEKPEGSTLSDPGKPGMPPQRATFSPTESQQMGVEGPLEVVSYHFILQNKKLTSTGENWFCLSDLSPSVTELRWWGPGFCLEFFPW